MQRRDLVVELIAALVEATSCAAGHFLRDAQVDDTRLRAVGGIDFRFGASGNVIGIDRRCSPALRRLPRHAGAHIRLNQTRRQLQHVERTTPIAICSTREQIQRIGLDGQLLFPQPPLFIGECSRQQLLDVLGLQRAQARTRALATTTRSPLQTKGSRSSLR